MHPQHALLAEDCAAGLAGVGDVGFDDSLAVLGGTEAQVGVIDGLPPELKLLVLLLVVLRDVDEALVAGIDTHGTVLLRTGDFLEDRNLVDNVVVYALLAEVVPALLIHAPHLVYLVARLAEPAGVAGESTADYDVLQVEGLHLLVGGRATQEAALHALWQFGGVAVGELRFVGELDLRIGLLDHIGDNNDYRLE